MDLTKYLYFIVRRSLFFVRADKLEDPFEGSFPIPDKQQKDVFLGRLSSKEHPIPPELLEKIRTDDAKITQNMRKDNFLNCWHIAEHESMAMWKVYGEQNKAIAIQSTYEKLHNAVSEYVTLGLVEYIDYEKGTMFEGKQYGAAHFFFKRKAFEYEKELRAAMGRWKPGAIDPNKQYDERESGWDYLIDPSAIVERLVVSPRMPEWIYSLTVELTHRLGFSFPIERSGLDTTPVF